VLISFFNTLSSGLLEIKYFARKLRTYKPKMSGLSNFAIQIQSWIFKTQSKSNYSPNIFWM